SRSSPRRGRAGRRPCAAWWSCRRRWGRAARRTRLRRSSGRDRRRRAGGRICTDRERGGRRWVECGSTPESKAAGGLVSVGTQVARSNERGCDGGHLLPGCGGGRVAHLWLDSAAVPALGINQGGICPNSGRATAVRAVSRDEAGVAGYCQHNLRQPMLRSCGNDGGGSGLKRRMAVLFVSHSSKDDAAASALEAWLQGNGITDIFVDHQSIVGGEKWRETLRASAGTCRVVLCLVSESWLTSNECFNEFRAA